LRPIITTQPFSIQFSKSVRYSEREQQQTVTVVSVSLAILAADAAQQNDEQNQQQHGQYHQHPPVVCQITSRHYTTCNASSHDHSISTTVNNCIDSVLTAGKVTV